MPPRIPILRSMRAKSSASALSWTQKSRKSIPLVVRLAPARHITADERPLPKADKPGPGPNQDQLPHVSEEAAAIGKITGEGGPDLDQGTPVEEVRPFDF